MKSLIRICDRCGVIRFEKRASNVTYVPMVYGTGTAICYVIPKEYTVENRSCLNEAKDRLKNVTSPSLYIEYVTPALKAVTLSITLSNDNLIWPILKELRTTYWLNILMLFS